MTPGFSPFIFGVYGKKPDRDTVDLFKKTGACGVLLLARNIDDAAQCRAYTEELVQRVGRPLLFTVDHEGGWVLRFSKGATPMPGNCALGRAADPELAYATGRQMALELSPLGIQVNLAPVLDVLTKTYNPGIGIRSFGADPALVGELGAAFTRGLQDHGVFACAKHFPGKGAATVDAHVEMPVIRLPKDRFYREHLRPFADAVDAGVASVMTSHVRYPALDPKNIATFSKIITRDILRKRLGFDGLVMADDLCMGAVASSQPIQVASVRAMEAGHDLLMVAHDKDAMRESSDLLKLAVADGLIDGKLVRDAERRVNKLMAPKKPKAKADALEGEALAARVARLGVRWARRGALAAPLAPSKEPLLVVFPDFKQVQSRFTFEGGPRGPEEFAKKRLAAWGPHKIVRAPVEAKDAAAIAAAARKASRVLFVCFEARRFPGQRAALEAVRRAAPNKTLAVLVRSAWDAELLPKETSVLDAGGYRLSQLSAALNEALA